MWHYVHTVFIFILEYNKDVKHFLQPARLNQLLVFYFISTTEKLRYTEHFLLHISTNFNSINVLVYWPLISARLNK